MTGSAKPLIILKTSTLTLANFSVLLFHYLLVVDVQKYQFCYS